MCGIAGFYAKHPGRQPADPAPLGAMLAIMANRGPDHHDTWHDPGAALGYVRLAIRGLGNGLQPITSRDERHVLVCNGEIYNYDALRAEIEGKLGPVFKTDSDVEVILHAYRLWPEDFIQRLNGQFAFALYDRESGKIILARDRAGICPLFYAEDMGQVVFASTIKALFKAGVSREFCPVGLPQIASFWSPTPPRTAFRDVRCLPPGHSLTISGTDLAIRPYWQLPFGQPPITTNIAEARDMVREQMAQAVRRCLLSEVPVALYLSGGIDSSILACHIHREVGDGFRTFSVSFEDSRFDESEYQDAMIRHIGAKHERMRVSQDDIAAALPDVVAQAETPLFRLAPVPLFLLSRAVRDHGYKVVLSGEGADEVFWGYDTYRELFVRQLWHHVPESAWRPKLLQKIFPYFPQYQDPRSFLFLKSMYAKSRDETSHPFYGLLPRWNTTSALHNYFTPDFRADPQDLQNRLLAAMPADFETQSPYERYQTTEMQVLLAGYLLSSQGDRMLMSHSVEGRFPFLDPDVMQLAARLPGWMKCKGLRDKWILRQAHTDVLPPQIARRSKFAYRAPDAASLTPGPGRPDYLSWAFDEQTARSIGVFDPDMVGRLRQRLQTTSAEKLTTRDDMAASLIATTHLLSQIVNG